MSLLKVQNEEVENLCILFGEIKSPERNHLQNAELLKQLRINECQFTKAFFNRIPFPLFEWNNFYQSTLLNCLTPFTAFVDYYLAFFGFPSSSITRDELLTFINLINDEIKEEDTELLNSTFGEQKSHTIHLPDVIQIMRKISRPFEPLVKFRKNCQEYLLGTKTCEIIQFRLDNLEMIESFRMNHNGAFPTISCCNKTFWKYHKNPYRYDFEPTMSDNELSLFSLINAYKQDFYGRRRSHPSIKRVISDGESYTNMAFGGYNRKKSTCSNRSSARSVIVSARVIQVANNNANNNNNNNNAANNAVQLSGTISPPPYQMNSNFNNNATTSGCGFPYMMSSSTTPNATYITNNNNHNSLHSGPSNSRKSPSQVIVIKSPKSPTLSDTIPISGGNSINNKIAPPPATLRITTTDHTSNQG